MEKILVTNREKSHREFRVPSGIASIVKGDNWMTTEDLEFLKEHSTTFIHFVKKGIFEVRDKTRPESEKEKQERKSIVAKMAKKARDMFPGINRATQIASSDQMLQPPDVTAPLDEFNQEIAKARDEELEAFQQKTEQLSQQALENAKGQARTDLETQVLPDIKDSFEKEINVLQATGLTNFLSSIDTVLEEKLTKFGDDLTAACKKEETTFLKKIKTAKKSG